MLGQLTKMTKGPTKKVGNIYRSIWIYSWHQLIAKTQFTTTSAKLKLLMEAKLSCTKITLKMQPTLNNGNMFILACYCLSLNTVKSQAANKAIFDSCRPLHMKTISNYWWPLSFIHIPICRHKRASQCLHLTKQY